MQLSTQCDTTWGTFCFCRLILAIMLTGENQHIFDVHSIVIVRAMFAEYQTSLTMTYGMYVIVRAMFAEYQTALTMTYGMYV